MADSGDGALFYTYDCTSKQTGSTQYYEGKRESIFIDTAVRGAAIDGLQVSCWSLDCGIWAYFRSCSGDDHHERTG